MRVKAKVVGHINIPEDKRIVLENKQVRGEDFSRRELMQFCSIGCHFETCRFENVCIGDAQLGSGRDMSQYVECSFDGLRFNHGGGHARFVRCSFRDVNLHSWFARTTELIDCVFSGRLNTAIFCGSIPTAEERAFLGRVRNEFRGNDFSALRMVDVDFVDGIDLTRQKLPLGPEYYYVAEAAPVMAKVKSDLESWNTSPEVLRAALIIVDGFKRIVDEGQRQLFFQSSTYYRISKDTFPREALDKVFEIIQRYSPQKRQS